MTQPDDTGLPPRRLPAVWTTTTWLVSAALLWLGCTALYFLTAPGRLDMIDGGIRYEVTSSLLEAGTPAIRNAAIPGVPGRLGQHYSYYPIGSSLIAVPFVWAADRGSRTDRSRRGSSPFRSCRYRSRLVSSR